MNKAFATSKVVPNYNFKSLLYLKVEQSVLMGRNGMLCIADLNKSVKLSIT